MKKIYIALVLVLLMPTLSLAQLADIDPENSSSCIELSNNLRYKATDTKTNGEVTVLQDFLQANGYLKSNPSGFFGILTTAAVKKFQIAHNISGTGYVGPLTRAEIKKVSCDDVVTTTPTTTTTQPIPTSYTLTTVFNRNLTFGAQGEDVIALQKFLYARGFLTATNGYSEANLGYFDQATVNALKTFQIVSGISPANGDLEVITRAVLNSKVVTPVTTTITPIPTVPSTTGTIYTSGPFVILTTQTSNETWELGRQYQVRWNHIYTNLTGKLHAYLTKDDEMIYCDLGYVDIAQQALSITLTENIKCNRAGAMGAALVTGVYKVKLFDEQVLPNVKGGYEIAISKGNVSISVPQTSDLKLTATLASNGITFVNSSLSGYTPATISLRAFCPSGIMVTYGDNICNSAIVMPEIVGPGTYRSGFVFTNISGSAQTISFKAETGQYTANASIVVAVPAQTSSISSVYSQKFGSAQMAAVGEKLTISGTNLRPVTHGTDPQVYLGSRRVYPDTVEDTKVTITIPSDMTEGTYDLYMIATGGKTNVLQMNIKGAVIENPQATSTVNMYPTRAQIDILIVDGKSYSYPVPSSITTSVNKTIGFVGQFGVGASAGTPINTTWLYGDGASTVGNVSANSATGGVVGQHAYTTPGTYTAVLVFKTANATATSSPVIIVVN